MSAELPASSFTRPEPGAESCNQISAVAVSEELEIATLSELFNLQIAPHICCGLIAHAAAAIRFQPSNYLILETIQNALVNEKVY